MTSTPIANTLKHVRTGLCRRFSRTSLFSTATSAGTNMQEEIQSNGRKTRADKGVALADFEATICIHSFAGVPCQSGDGFFRAIRKVA